MKFRIGWGKTGSSYGDGSKSIAQISTSKMYYYWWNGVNYTEQMGAAKDKEIDTNLHWETNEQTNLGIDMGFMDNALNVTLDYFIRNSYDLLLDRNMRPSTGFTSVYTNAGHIRNKGFEISAAWNKSFGDWNVGVRVNGSTLKNEAVEVGDPIFYKNNSSGGTQDGDDWDNHSITQNGYAVGSYYGWKVAGIFQNQQEIDALNAQSPTGKYQDGDTAPGDFKYIDLNGDGQITDEDRTVIGNGFPTLSYGLNLTASYKNFDFSMNMYGVAGMDIYSYSAARLTSMYGPDGGYQNVLAEYVKNAWTLENPNGKYPRITKGDHNKNHRASDAFIKKGDYLKISNIQVCLLYTSDAADE